MTSVSPSHSRSVSPTSVPAARKDSWVAQSRNPVSLRLYKVLGSNYEDDATKEALCTLSDLYVTAPSRAINHAQLDLVDGELLLDSDEERIANPHLDSVSVSVLSESVPGESAARARKNLRKDMEAKVSEGSRQFLKALGEVDEKLDELQRHVSGMRQSCDEAEAQLLLTTEASKTLLERAGNLREERQEVENKKSIVTLFLARFTLKDEEVEAITSRDIPVGTQFFDAMDKTKRIRDDCRILMAGEDGPTKAGLDIMASTSSHLEQGYEKISRWCSHVFQAMSRDMHVDISQTMREAIRRLRKRPELLTEVLTLFSQTRQTTLLSSFLKALTRGGPSGLPRPIELHAHDPLRYIGDMLAWVHQAIAAERELLESLFGLGGDGRMVGSIRVFDEDSEEEEWMRELMDACVGKLCTPLKIRVQQTVRSQESSIVSYKIANLLQFYLITMRRTLGENALLSKTLLEITDIAYNVFYESIEAQGRALLRVPLDVNDPSLNPPLAILDHAQVLREIMTVYQSSLLGDEDNAEQVAGFEKILDIMVDPAVEMCASTSEEKKRVRPRWDQAVYILNCLSYLQNILELFSFTREKQQKVQKLIEERECTLTDEHFANIMVDAGISRVVDTCTTRQTNEPLSHIPSTLPSELQTALGNFSLWLSGPEVVQSHRLSQLTVQRLHTQIHHAALERMARAYQKICEEVKKPENKYEAALTLLGSERPFGQVHLLWQIFGLDEDKESA